MQDHRSGWKAAVGFALAALASGWVLYIWRKAGSRGVSRVVTRVAPRPATFLRLAPLGAFWSERLGVTAKCRRAPAPSLTFEAGLLGRRYRGFRPNNFLRLDSIRCRSETPLAAPISHAVP